MRRDLIAADRCKHGGTEGAYRASPGSGGDLPGVPPTLPKPRLELCPMCCLTCRMFVLRTWPVADCPLRFGKAWADRGNGGVSPGDDPAVGLRRHQAGHRRLLALMLANAVDVSANIFMAAVPPRVAHGMRSGLTRST